MLSELPPHNHHHLQQPRLLTSKSSTSSAGLSTGSTRPSTANSSSSNTFQRREDYYSDTSDSDSDPEVEDITKKGSRQSRNPSFHRHPIPTTSSPLFPGTMNLPSSSQQQGLKSSDLFSFHPPSTPNSPSQSFNHIHMSGSSRAPPSPHPKKDSKPCSILRKSSSSSSSTSSSINNHHHQGLRKKSSSKPSLNSSTDNQEWSRGIVDLQDERQRKELELKLQSEEQSEMIFENQRGFNRDLEGMLGLNLFDENDDDDEDDKFHQYDKVHQDQLRSSSSQLNTNQKNGERKISKQRNSRSSSDSSSRGLNSHHGISFNNKHKNSIRSIRKGRSESSPIIPSEKTDHLVGQHFSSLPPSPCSSPKLKHKTSSNSNGLGLSNLETISSSNPSSPKHSFNLNLPGYDFIPSTLSTIPPTPSAAAATWIDPSALNYFPAGLRTKEKSRKSSFCKDRNGSPRKEKNPVSSPRESSDFGGTLDSSSEINNRSSNSNQTTSNTSSPTSSDTSSSTSTLPQTPSDSDHHKKQVNCPATSAFKEISDPTHGSKMYYFRREVQNLGLKIRFGVHDVKKKLH